VFAGGDVPKRDSEVRLKADTTEKVDATTEE